VIQSTCSAENEPYRHLSIHLVCSCPSSQVNNNYKNETRDFRDRASHHTWVKNEFKSYYAGPNRVGLTVCVA